MTGLLTPGRRPGLLQLEAAQALEFVAQEEGLGRSQLVPTLAPTLMPVTQLVYPQDRVTFRLPEPVVVLELMLAAAPEAVAWYSREFLGFPALRLLVRPRLRTQT
jgi:hypothetical protein